MTRHACADIYVVTGSQKTTSQSFDVLEVSSCQSSPRTKMTARPACTCLVATRPSAVEIRNDSMPTSSSFGLSTWVAPNRCCVGSLDCLATGKWLVVGDVGKATESQESRRFSTTKTRSVRGRCFVSISVAQSVDIGV